MNKDLSKANSAPPSPSPDGRLLHSFVQRAANAHPDCIALDIPPGTDRPSRIQMTYRELDDLSNRLAMELAPNLTAECIALIHIPRHHPLLHVAMLAVLKAGAAYTCADPSFPAERIREMVTDAGCPLALTLKSPAPGDFPCATRALLPWLESRPQAEPPWHNPPPPDWQTDRSLAYVIYTSGTTGTPKGVQIEHRSIVNLVASDLAEFSLGPGDRVAQGSSAAYDSSIEEIWLAWAAGATLVVMDDTAARLGPDLIQWLRDEKITVFCPPPTQLRATGCDNPAEDLPDLKLLYVGGEPLPADLAARWSQGRRLVNGYGPTECAVTCLRETIHAGDPISIGRAIPGMQAWVLDSDLNPLPPGSVGELCISGIGLARGYRHRPEETLSRFIDHPTLGRLYRTGDSVECDTQGRFFYLGRLDAQVKLRGYRLELEEIEARLQMHPGVRTAACRIQGQNENALLVAWIVASDPNAPPTEQLLRDWLQTTLPPAMIPSRIGLIDELPTTVGGKLKRSALPELEAPAPSVDESTVLLCNDAERIIHAVWQAALNRPHPIRRDLHFFTDLGGDSLTAAIAVTELRKHPATAGLAVRDLYEAPSIESLAMRCGAGTAPSVSTQPHTPTPPPPASAAALALQAAWLIGHLAAESWLAYGTAVYLLPWLTLKLGIAGFLALSPLLAALGVVLYLPLSVGLAIVTKRVLIGVYHPINVPVWSVLGVRHWMVVQTARAIPWWLVAGTEWECMILRLLGARIGRNVHLHRGAQLWQGGWDLLDLGDDVTLNQDASLRVCALEYGRYVFAAIHLGSGVTLGVQSTVAGGARLRPNSMLAARSSLPHGVDAPEGRLWDGIPAKPVSPAPQPPEPSAPARPWTAHQDAAWNLSTRLALSLLLRTPAALCGLVAIQLAGITTLDALTWWDEAELGVPLLAACAGVALVSTPIHLLAEALACRFLGRVPTGVLHRRSPGYARLWLKAELMESGSRWLYGTMLWPWWLRIAGMRVGRGCEISTLIDTIPELVEIGEFSFCADGVYLAGPALHRGRVELAPVRIGSHCFLGNGAVVPCGVNIPNRVLIGVCTSAAQAPLRSGSSWFGHPAFELPHREVVDFDRRLTHAPSRSRILVRWFWELARFALPLPQTLAWVAWFAWINQVESWVPPWFPFAAVIPAMSLLAAAIPTACTIGLKWMLLGRVKPGVHPLWSSWASRWDFVCLAWSISARDAVNALEGTPFLSPLLRAMGMKVGRNVTIGHGVFEDLPDPDMLTLGDGATVDCLFQAHTFEDRALKTDRVRIDAGANVGRHTVVLYGAEIGVGSTIAPNSVVLKHEQLPGGHCYEGFPVRQLRPDKDDGGPTANRPHKWNVGF